MVGSAAVEEAQGGREGARCCERGELSLVPSFPSSFLPPYALVPPSLLAVLFVSFVAVVAYPALASQAYRSSPPTTPFATRSIPFLRSLSLVPSRRLLYRTSSRLVVPLLLSRL